MRISNRTALSFAGVLVVNLLAAWLTVTPAFASDGIWYLRERFCIRTNGEGGCSRGAEEFMLLGSVAYYRGSPEDEWTEVGAVGTSGKKITIEISRAGVARLIAGRTGVDISESIEEFSFNYRARLAGAKLRKGKVRVRLVFTYQGAPYRIEGGGTFQGKRTGDAYPPPPPDPYFGEFSVDTAGRERPRGWQGIIDNLAAELAQ